MSYSLVLGVLASGTVSCPLVLGVLASGTVSCPLVLGVLPSGTVCLALWYWVSGPWDCVLDPGIVF